MIPYQEIATAAKSFAAGDSYAAIGRLMPLADALMATDRNLAGWVVRAIHAIRKELGLAVPVDPVLGARAALMAAILQAHEDQGYELAEEALVALYPETGAHIAEAYAND